MYWPVPGVWVKAQIGGDGATMQLTLTLDGWGDIVSPTSNKGLTVFVLANAIGNFSVGAVNLDLVILL